MRSIFTFAIILLTAAAPVQAAPTAQVMPAHAQQGPGDSPVYLPMLRNDQPNRAPNAPSAPKPASGATNQATGPLLAWTGGDPDGHKVSYTVYLDTKNPPAATAAAGLTSPSYQAAGLNLSTQYYWRVKATDAYGLSTSGPVWSFKTGSTVSAPVKRLSSFYTVYCAVTGAGGVQCWGEPDAGWDGQVFPNQSNVPVSIAGLSGIKSVGVGDGFACALSSGGGVKCWGNNVSGQLGNGTNTASASPVNVSGLSSGVKQIAVGGLFACALLDGGAVKCWGNNTNGQLGIGSLNNQTTPQTVINLGSASAISAGERHACAIASGALLCWGSSEFYQVGSHDVDTFEFTDPEPVYTLGSGVTAVAAGRINTCAITSGGGLKCWGYNGGGELGNGNDYQTIFPTDVIGLQSGVKSVDTGNHTCAVLNDGTARCMGWNLEGELGTGTRGGTSFTPVVAQNISGIAEIITGNESTCALLTSGTLKCWGANDFGQLGAGLTSAYSLTPMTVIGW